MSFREIKEGDEVLLFFIHYIDLGNSGQDILHGFKVHAPPGYLWCLIVLCENSIKPVGFTLSTINTLNCVAMGLFNDLFRAAPSFGDDPVIGFFRFVDPFFITIILKALSASCIV